MSDLQALVQKHLDDAVNTGRETGLQVAVYFQGRLVADAWAGWLDDAHTRRVDGDSLFPVFSCSKGVTATLVHRLAEKGTLSYETPIAAVWPEFAKHGKGAITLRHALNHASGVPHVPEKMTLDEFHDFELGCKTMADLAPLYPPGRIEYHACSYSWLIAGFLQRVDKRPFARMFHEEVCAPLGIRDMYIGLPAELDARVAELREDNPGPFKPNEFGAYTVPPSRHPLHGWMNTPAARRACLPSSNGIMSARAMAKHYAALVPGGIGGVELLKPATIKKATELYIPPGVKEADLAGRFGLGYQLGGGKDSRQGVRATAFGHGGYGGTIAFADPEYKFAIGVTKNYFSPKPIHVEIVDVIRKALEIP